MVIRSKRQKLKKLPKRTKNRVNNLKTSKKINKVIKYVEKFQINKKLEENDDQLRQCNEILIRDEKKCNKLNEKGSPKKFSINECKEKHPDPSCQDFQKCKCKLAEYMSGHEPLYDPDHWSKPIIEGSHNCYTYFLNNHIPEVMNECNKMCKKKGSCHKKINSCGNLKPQPGDYAAEVGITNGKNRKYTCDEMVKKVISDNTHKKTKKKYIHKVAFNRKCPPNYYKGVVVVDPNSTYHFYRQDNNVRYSHKQGTLRVENVDASGKPIYIPHLADMNYNKEKRKNGINYTNVCDYMCVPNNEFIKTHAI